MAKKNYFGHVFFRAQYRSLVDGGVLLSLAAIQPLATPQLTPGGGRWVHVPAADCEASQKAFMDRYK